MNFCRSLCGLVEYFRKKKLPQITHANHMTMTTINSTGTNQLIGNKAAHAYYGNCDVT